ncbi:aspartate carbamoyltransferase regulatory subunit [Eubacterium sp.]
MEILNIDSIENGYVIDHIPAGKGMQIYNILSLDKLFCQVAIITNAKSKKNDVKDIIKINELVDLDLDVIAYIAPNATVNVIKNSERIDKKNLSLPKEIKNVVKCPNPRCISNNEDIDHIFKLTDEKGTYRCLYCETMAL